MIISCVLPVLAAALFAAVAPSVSRRARPGLAVWMLSAGGLALTLCELSAVAVVVALGAGQLAPLARLGHWSPRAVGLDSPFQTWSIWVATILLGVAAARATKALWSHGRRLWAAWSASRAAPAGLVVLADDKPYAYAVPGWPGRIVVSHGLLHGLDGSGRRALLVHEQTHLTERHDLHQFAAAMATALNPLLFRSPAALYLACERRADEVAAEAVGDREAVVRAITTAVRPQLSGMAWDATGADVQLRVQALLSPPRDSRPVAALLVLVVLLTIAASTASVLWLGHDLRSVFIAAHR
jgi:Zn-dependent protease with chaperone function